MVSIDNQQTIMNTTQHPIHHYEKSEKWNKDIKKISMI